MAIIGGLVYLCKCPAASVCTYICPLRNTSRVEYETNMGTILTSLLPGIRQLRAPLAAGYFWLLVLWLVLHDLFLDRKQISGLITTVRMIANTIGPVAFAAAITFLAFLLGTIATPLNSGAGQIYSLIKTRRSRRFARIRSFLPASPIPKESGWFHVEAADPYAPLMRQMLNILWSRLRSDEPFLKDMRQRLKRTGLQQLNVSWTALSQSHAGSFPIDSAMAELTPSDRPATRPLPPLSTGILSFGTGIGLAFGLLRVEEYWNELVDDVVYFVPQRLLGKEPELYAAYDRYKAEEQFRLALVPPLLMLSILSVTHLYPDLLLVPLLGIGSCVALLSLAHDARRRAVLQLVEFIAAGRIESPLLIELAKGKPKWRPDGEALTLLKLQRKS